MKLEITIDLETGEVEEFYLSDDGMPSGSGKTLDEAIAKYEEDAIEWMLWYMFKERLIGLSARQKELLTALCGLGKPIKEEEQCALSESP